MIDRKIGDKPINFEVTIGATLICSSSTATETTASVSTSENVFSLCQVTMETRLTGL